MYSIFLEFKNRASYKGFRRKFQKDGLGNFISPNSSGKIIELIFDDPKKTETIGRKLQEKIGENLKTITYPKSEQKE